MSEHGPSIGLSHLRIREAASRLEDREAIGMQINALEKALTVTIGAGGNMYTVKLSPNVEKAIKDLIRKDFFARIKETEDTLIDMGVDVPRTVVPDTKPKPQLDDPTAPLAYKPGEPQDDETLG